MDRTSKGLKEAERLLRQGKVQAALAQIQRVSEEASDDLLTLNRLGDLLARQGQNAEAINYYRRIAGQFAESGFLPKATAIHKKILRLDPDNVESMVSLGQLYIDQNLQGEARKYLLKAAGLRQGQGQFSEAREILLRLVEAEPEQLRHRTKLAELRGAEGDRTGASEELRGLGTTLLGRGEAAEAEKAFKQALEWAPGDRACHMGLSQALSAQGRSDEMISLLAAAASDGAGEGLHGSLALCYAEAGRAEEALALLEAHGLAIEADAWCAVFKAQASAGAAEALWARMGPRLDGFAQSDPGGTAVILEALFDIESDGHLPAMKRCLDLYRRLGDSPGTTRALEALVQSYRARSMMHEASEIARELKKQNPDSPLLGGEVPTPAAPVTRSAPTKTPGAAARPQAPAGPVPLEFEAPAVPLTRSDEEFVAGRMTQAEVLEKYGLRPQALEQLEEVTARFPGHLKAQENRVQLLRQQGAGPGLGATLVELALAQRASGDAASARQSASEAIALGGVVSSMRVVLEQIGLLAPSVVPAPATTPTTPTTTPAAAAKEPAAGAVPISSSNDDLVLDLHMHDADETQVPATPPGVAEAPAARRTREPSSDMLEEIELYLRQGAPEDAGRRVAALRALGYASEALDEVSARVEQSLAAGTEVTRETAPEEDFVLDLDSGPVAADPPAPEPVAPPPAVEAVSASEAEPAVLSLDLDAEPEAEAPTPEPVAVATQPSAEPTPEPTSASVDPADDLSEITAALAHDLFEAGDEPVVPEEDPQQSVAEVVSNFREAVKAEVDEDDYRTHYDLGIAYKEMGLTEEAIAEFTIASGSADLYREACSMIGLCHRELNRMGQAVEWYRQAIDASRQEPQTLLALQYELAEILVETGDMAAALDELRDVERTDPTYRDVRTRISELETNVASSSVSG